MPDLVEDRDAYFIDAKDNVWIFDPVIHRWWSPLEPGVLCGWVGLTALAHGLRRASVDEVVEINREVFS